MEMQLVIYAALNVNNSETYKSLHVVLDFRESTHVYDVGVLGCLLGNYRVRYLHRVSGVSAVYTRLTPRKLPCRHT